MMGTTILLFHSPLPRLRSHEYYAFDDFDVKMGFLDLRGLRCVAVRNSADFCYNAHISRGERQGRHAAP